MKNKYLRLKLAIRRNKRTKEFIKKENDEKVIKVLTDELNRVIIESR